MADSTTAASTGRPISSKVRRRRGNEGDFGLRIADFRLKIGGRGFSPKSPIQNPKWITTSLGCSPVESDLYCKVMPATVEQPQSVRERVQDVINLIRPSVQADGGDI